MTIDINAFLYVIGALITIFSLFIAQGYLPSYFSRGRVIDALRHEIQSIDVELEGVGGISHKYIFKIYLIFILILPLFLLKSQFTTKTVFFMVIGLSYLFMSIMDFLFKRIGKLSSLSTMDIRDKLSRINTIRSIFLSISLSTLLLLFTALLQNFISPFYFSINVVYFFTTVFLGIFNVMIFLVFNSLLKRRIEDLFLSKLIGEKKLPAISIKIRMGNFPSLIQTVLVSVGSSSLILRDHENFILQLHYKKISDIYAKEAPSHSEKLIE